ncbi:hypothetical protein QF037_003151 [Streptomyces canus]|nr:hypothetical protein [Streptomyces canus]
MPAGILIWAWWRQVLIGSPQASTWKVQWPGSPAVTSAPQRSVPGTSSRIGVQGPGRPSGSFSTTLAATASCPSRNTVAEISNVSPVTAFAGRRPRWTIGRTSRTGMRPMPSPVEGGSGGGGWMAAECCSAGVSVPAVGGADEWCVAGMTAPVRVNVGGRMAVGRWVLRGVAGGCTGGAFPPYSGEQSGTLLTTHAYVYTQDRPRSRRTGPVPAHCRYGTGTCSSLFGEASPRPEILPETACATSALDTCAGVALGWSAR